jgi:DNA processing protein
VPYARAMDAARVRSRLARAPGLAAGQLRALLAAGGDLEHACTRAALAAVPLPPAAHACLACSDEADIDADLAWAAASGTQLLLCIDADYPPLLAATSGAPAALYVQGSTALLAAPQLAMVGSRSPTPAGRATAREFAAHFARAGLTITSGLALGIDAASHEGALRGGGATIAVCATGLDRVYPAEHASLATRIRECGALVSEFPPGTPPRRANFPLRNRIISGLTLGTLVVEAGRRSGALITARLALESGRDVFAIPGSIHSPQSRGCHQLIRDGARLVEAAADVWTELQIPVRKEPLRDAVALGRAAPELDKEYEMLLDALGFEPATMDALVARTGLPTESIASMLLILELEGRIQALAGGCYGRAP